MFAAHQSPIIRPLIALFGIIWPLTLISSYAAKPEQKPSAKSKSTDVRSMAVDFTARSNQVYQKPTELLTAVLNSKGSFNDTLATTAKSTETAISTSETNLKSLRDDIESANTKLERNTKILNESGASEYVRGYLVEKVEPLKKQIEDAQKQFESSILVLRRIEKKLVEWKNYYEKSSEVGASTAREAEKEIREEIRQELDSIGKQSGKQN
jgi:hypothetical protein